jgi:RND family efflux transporter MFP subunit
LWHVVRSVLSAVVAVAVLALFLAWMGGAFREKVHPGELSVERSSAAGRKLVEVERERAEDAAVVVGSVQPRKKTDVASQLLASVREVKVSPGDRVEEKAELVILDDRELLAQQNEAQATQSAAEADLVVRKGDFERAKMLRQQGSIGAEDFSRIEGALRVAESQVVRTKATVARLAVQLSHTKIVAPAKGLIADRFVDPGDLATPGKPLLVIYDPADLEFHTNVPETLAPALTVGQTLGVRIDAAGLSVTGTVREVVPQAQQASHSVLVKVTLPPIPSTGPLLPGMFGRVSLPTGTAERLWVPKAAVARIGQLDLVEVANPDGTLTRRFVRIGPTAREPVGIVAGLAAIVGGWAVVYPPYADRVEILSGLTAGETVALPAK